MKRFFCLLTLPLLLTGCNETPPDTSEKDTAPSTSDTSTQKEEEVPLLPGLPVMNDEGTHNSNGVTEEMALAAIQKAYARKSELSEVTCTKQSYLRGRPDANFESLTRKYTFSEDPVLGTVMQGRALLREGNGIFAPELIPNSGYDYTIQAYTEGGYLHYIEKLDEGAKGRISYDDISKNNRYNNLYTIYKANPDLVMMESAIEAIKGYHGAGKETVRYLDTIGDEVILKIVAKSFEASTGYHYEYFNYIHLNKEGTELLRIDHGWYVYDLGADVLDESHYQSTRVDSCFGFAYNKRPSWSGVKLTEKDVDKIYGGPALHDVDVSKLPDGFLNEEDAKNILLNLPTFAKGTTSSEAVATYDNFIDPQRQANGETGEYQILGTATANATTKAYLNDFVETKGKIRIVNSSVGTEEVAMTSQACALDDGMYVVTEYDKVLTSHRHLWAASQIEDTDPQLGVSPIYRPEIYEPFRIAGNIGLNCTGNSSLDNDNNTYTAEGTVSKQGNRISGRLSKVYHKNVWTPYWTFTAGFEIVDGFLEEISLNVKSYRESDTMQITFNTNLSFTNKKGETLTAFTGTELDPNLYQDGMVMAKNEWLYM